MLVNSTSSLGLGYLCSSSGNLIIIFAGMMVTKVVLVLPLCIFILYLGYGQWRRQRSLKTASHCDVFTYHLSLIELFWGPGCLFYICGRHSSNLAMILLGASLFSFTFLAQICFHALTCVERYLAVVHPIVYLTLKNARGIRIRNITISCVWLLCFGLTTLHTDLTLTYITMAVIIIMVIAIAVITYCSLSVLWILMHPGPGDGGREKARVAQSKRRAFNTITAILGVLMLWCLGVFVSNSLFKSSLLGQDAICPIMASVNWLNLPISLMGPLLYLSRSGKLACCS